MLKARIALAAIVWSWILIVLPTHVVAQDGDQTSPNADASSSDHRTPGNSRRFNPVPNLDAADLGNLVEQATRELQRETFRTGRTPGIILGVSDVNPEAAEAIRSTNNDFATSQPNFRDDLRHDERMHLLEQELDEGIVGQPELKKVILDIERRTGIMGPNRREKPEIIYMMGLPNSGQEDAVYAYANGLHGSPHGDLHVFKLPPVKTESDFSTVFGSRTGYYGSDGDMPKFIQFLVNHSSGRYELMLKQEKERPKEFVYENPSWKPNRPGPHGTFGPDRGIVYIPNFNLWPKEMKEEFFDCFEDGEFTIRAPGDGVSKIVVPVTFMISSDEGSELITARDNNGNRIGKSLSFDQIMQKHEKVKDDKSALKASMASQRFQQMGGEKPGGISERMMNIFPTRNIVLLRPLSVDGLEQKARTALDDLKQKYASASGEFGGIKVDIDDEVLKFIASFRYDAEDGDKGLANRLSWIENGLMEAVESLGNSSASEHFYRVQIKRNDNQTYSLVVDYTPADRETKRTEIALSETADEAPVERMSIEEIRELRKTAEKLNERVFGVNKLAGQLQDTMLMSRERAHALSRDKESKGAPASVYLLLGLSGTGKTETTKVLGSLSKGGEAATIKFDFTNVRTIFDLREKILGTRDELGRAKKSAFMEHYDKYDGNIIVTLDEIANCPREVLKGLYDIFDEPLVTAFSDGKARKMGGVTIIGTGNAGEEWFQGIPREAPKYQQMLAMERVYDEVMKDAGYRRSLLEKYFSEALLNRIGEKNIFFFAPLTFKVLRQLSILKLDLAIESLKATESRWGWNIMFSSDADYGKLLETIETDGFVVREQGRSLDHFVKGQFANNVYHALLGAEVPAGSNVSIKYLRSEDDTESNIRHSYWAIEVDGQEPIEFSLEGAQDQSKLLKTDEQKILTAYHEVGHELVRHALFGDAFKATQVSIVPGVTKMGGGWIYYSGIARYDSVTYVPKTWEAVVAEIAVKMAGTVAEELVANKATAGKAQDILSSSLAARHAIIEYGLSKRFGNYAYTGDMKVEEFIANLTPARLQVLDEEVSQLLKEGEELARRTIIANYNSHFIPMSVALAEKGELNGDEIAAFYKDQETLQPESAPKESRLGRLFGSLLGKVRSQPRSISADLHSSTPRPDTVADIDDLVNARRREQTVTVPLSPKRKIARAGSTGETREMKLPNALRASISSSCRDQWQ